MSESCAKLNVSLPMKIDLKTKAQDFVKVIAETSRIVLLSPVK